jgi:rubredoxin
MASGKPTTGGHRVRHPIAIAGDSNVNPHIFDASRGAPDQFEPPKTPNDAPLSTSCADCGSSEAAYTATVAATGARVVLCTGDANARDERGELVTASVRRLGSSSRQDDRGRTRDADAWVITTHDEQRRDHGQATRRKRHRRGGLTAPNSRSGRSSRRGR